jgi:hypothetical protein
MAGMEVELAVMTAAEGDKVLPEVSVAPALEVR